MKVLSHFSQFPISLLTECFPSTVTTSQHLCLGGGCICLCEYRCVCLCAKARGWWWGSSSLLSTLLIYLFIYLFIIVLFIYLILVQWGFPASTLQGSTLSTPFLSTGGHKYLAFFVGVGEQNIDHHVYVASLSQQSHTPQPQMDLIFDFFTQWRYFL